jgi:hypothetical protein
MHQRPLGYSNNKENLTATQPTCISISGIVCCDGQGVRSAGQSSLLAWYVSVGEHAVGIERKQRERAIAR